MDMIMNSTDVKVSVVMPIYNAYDYLRPAIDSIICQTLGEIELICVDDGSTDQSLDIIRQYQKKDARIRIVTQTNAGPAVARNNGIRRARGEYIAFLDADDFYDPTLLETLYVRAKEEDLDIAIAEYDIYHSQKATFAAAKKSPHHDVLAGGKVTSKNEHPNVIFSVTNGAAWNKLFRLSFILDNGLLFPTDMRVFEDVYFVLGALSLAERVQLVCEVLVHHRIYSDQARAKLFRKYYTQIPEIYLRFKEFLMSRGMYAPLFSSYLNYTAGRTARAFSHLSSDAKERLWNMLHDEYSERMDWHGRRLSDFETVEACEFAANVEMFTYDQYKKFVAKGKKLNVKSMKSTFRLGKRRRRLANFFAKIFNIKKTR